MTEYSGNAIYDYVVKQNLNYYFSAKDNWILVYGDSTSVPKVLAFVSRTNHLTAASSKRENAHANKAFNIANDLRLPFLYVRFVDNSDMVAIWEGRDQVWKQITYDQLRTLYEVYGVVQPGTARKMVNQYLSSSYHDWQRHNLGRITVSDFDLLKYKNNRIEEIIELKKSKIPLESWSPYSNDFPNFALLLNAIVNSGRNIPFTLYYNVMKKGIIGNREEDISKIKVFEFEIPDRMIGSHQISYRDCGIHTLDELL